ncbi:BREX-1 system adenine-specific DNA-methyltransferase PglX [Thauera aromatica]|uniref:BREX-1 system adenine-specific DNA-methyltransferase PglX n=1 Tax=Thauera aromatica TaxID=59405 RepID=UPI001FFD12DD|nr:BREX-1 system adenine-specific DNA-methyltransferase PglX [Thauera aromatica]MCK2088040.1 BREX-1 system adenine-specific DNA-methyltransferase PglX [Thauera aromatica]
MTQASLAKPLRTQLENTVKSARDIAETAARAALQQLAVGEGRAPDYLNDEQRALRRRLRAHGRSLGDAKHGDDTQELRRLVWEVAYEHWHRMLFARFLAENGLLLWEPGAAVSLQDCREMVDHHPEMAMGARSEWELAGKLAARMLPQVFKPQHPVFELVFAPEHQRELERLLSGLPPEVFQASDSLGWVYQFWQARRKDEVNASEVKIGADELPAVTQLFTEPYMVDFLLHNSLGAWWLTRHPDTPCPVPLTYLRTLDDGTPAAGKFEGWPDTLADFKLLDPCCGSGHFLVAAFLMLVPMRMTAEHLSAREAVDAVLRDNLHGLELDPRCVEIAVFALALAAWRFPDEAGQPLGVRAHMPAPNVACCGLKVAARAPDWMALVPENATEDVPNPAYLRQELRLLHDSFSQAPLLGSLLDPARSLKNDLATPSFDTLRALLERALSTERPATLWGEGNEVQDEAWDHALTARGLLDAARLLDARYHLVATNVPYLARGKQSDALKAFCETHYPDAKNDLANVFLERCLELSQRGAAGVVQIVMPQNWLFLTSYKKQRESLLKRVQWNLLARLGPGAFETISGEVVQAVLLTQTHAPADEAFDLRGVDASGPKGAVEKAALLREGEVVSVGQKGQLGNPDARVMFGESSSVTVLNKFAYHNLGICTGDSIRFYRKHWEFGEIPSGWAKMQSTVDARADFSGCESLVFWEDGNGALYDFVVEKLGEDQVGSWLRGKNAWGRQGVLISAMRDLPATSYLGGLFDENAVVLIAEDEAVVPALWCYCADPSYAVEVRKANQTLKVRGDLVKVPFDLAHWQQVAAERYPNGLPKPYSDDPTQWLFHGHPQPATDPLQVAVARLLGYRWPAETDADMELADEARQWIAHTDKLAAHADDDGIVCLPAVRGEKPAFERLLALLIDAWETVTPGSWKASTLDRLLAEADCAGKSLEVWLREKFFEQHAKRFHHRPFIWHVWDGLKDGFGALVNYHKLDARNLERLIHTYLGDWIRIQEAGVASGLDGAPQRLAAAQALKKKLEAILEGEAPFDIFVRWKPLAEQPIGWNPDLNDGVRLNIRPWMTAGVLRHNKGPKLNIKWDKDRGKDVESAPWFAVFNGDRINDHHLTLVEKRAAASKEKEQ